jgi:hypothetical protein
MIQKYVRGMQTRKKFQRLKKCLELITRIQRAFRKRFKFVNDKATEIQSAFRKALAKDRYNRKKQRYDTSLVDPEEEYYDSSDEDQIRQVKERKKKRELDKKIEKQKQIADYLAAKLEIMQELGVTPTRKEWDHITSLDSEIKIDAAVRSVMKKRWAERSYR